MFAKHSWGCPKYSATNIFCSSKQSNLLGNEPVTADVGRGPRSMPLPAMQRTSRGHLVNRPILRSGAYTLLAAAAFLITECTLSTAKPCPSRVVRIVVPFPSGGLVDGVARLLQPGLQNAFDKPVIIDNRPAASGSLGTDIIAKSAPDGCNLLMVASTHTVAPATNPRLPYDIEKDLTPIGLIARNPLLFIINKDLPPKTLAEFVALAKTEPDKLSYASPGSASQSHLLTELFSQRAGIKMLHVPYRGGAPAILSVISGETDFAILSTQISAAQLAAGKVRALAAGGTVREREFAAIPTLAEAGFPDIEAIQWVGMLGPAKLPSEVVDDLHDALSRVLRDSDTPAKLASQSMAPALTSPDEFRQLIRREVKTWTEIARSADIKASD